MTRRAVTVDVGTCPRGILSADHWGITGVCKCISDKVEHVEKILEGAWSAMELLSPAELQYLQKVYSTRSMLQQQREDMARNTMITVFVRGHVEERILRDAIKEKG